MKIHQKLINLGILVGFLICYLEWPGHSSFLFQLEFDILAGNISDRSTFTHPLVLIPFAGQLFILYTLFQKIPNRRLVSIGVILMSVLVGLIFIIGVMGMQFGIFSSTLLFIICSILHFKNVSEVKL